MKALYILICFLIFSLRITLKNIFIVSGIINGRTQIEISETKSVLLPFAVKIIIYHMVPDI